MKYFLHELPDGIWLPALGKQETLLKTVKGSYVLPTEPEKLQKDLVCIVDNRTYESARYINNQSVLDEWRRNNIKKTWMVIPGIERMIN